VADTPSRCIPCSRPRPSAPAKANSPSRAPVRVLDTRKPIGVPGGIVKLQSAGADGVPSGAAAVALTVTATNIAGGGFVDGGGGIDLYNGSPGTAQLIVDVSGYYS